MTTAEATAELRRQIRALREEWNIVAIGVKMGQSPEGLVVYTYEKPSKAYPREVQGRPVEVRVSGGFRLCQK